METAMAVVAALVAVGLFAGAVVLRRRTPPDEEQQYDPMFYLGIVFTGTGVALATSVGRAMYGLMAFGLILMMAGAVRSRRSDHH